MIIDIILVGFFELVRSIFSIIPDLASMPAGFATFSDNLVDTLELPIGFLQYILSYSLYVLILPLIILLLNFTWVWRLTLFVLSKIPFINISR